MQTKFTEINEFQTLICEEQPALRMCQSMDQALSEKHKTFLSPCLLVCKEGTKSTGYVAAHLTPCFRRSDIIE